jgi:SAM-dependent methyltransferase
MTTMLDDERFFVFDWDAVFDVDDYLHFYEETLRAERTEHQVDVLEQHLFMLGPMRVLDLGCGHGRHAIELARRGHEVTGLDRTQAFLDLARKEADAQRLPIDLVHGDMREIEYDEAFDRVICLFDGFGLHRDEENADVLRRVARALRPGGRACIDVRNRDWMVRALLPVTVLQKGADLMIDRHVIEPLTGRLVDFRVVVRDGRTKEARWSVRLYTFSELRGLLAAVGLRVTEVFGSWDLEPLSLAHHRMVVMVEKR